jgi:uncharacterized protein (UPF0333 family)
MNKKIISLLFLLIILVSVTISYAYFSQPSTNNSDQTRAGADVAGSTVSSEMDSTLLDENTGVEIGDMI